ncbi:MAG TPA: hypothetical protein VNT79_15450, partial [Phycisphaerae bacterium]|nr:hypothetical protein [Phycisphaerae bacterium]
MPDGPQAGMRATARTGLPAVIHHSKPASDYHLKTGHFEELSVRLEVLSAKFWLQESIDGEPTQDGR